MIARTPRRPRTCANRAIPLVFALAASLAAGCAETDPHADPDDESTHYFYDFPAALELTPALDLSHVRVGLFAETAAADVLHGGVADDRMVSLRVSQPDGGRVRAWVLDENGTHDPTLEAEAITVRPQFLLSTGRSGELVLDLPYQTPDPLDESYLLVAWYDADGDSALDLGVTSESEATRPFVCTHEGRTLMLSHLEPNFTKSPGESDGDLVWTGYGIDEASMLTISDEWPEPWEALLDAATDPPLD